MHQYHDFMEHVLKHAVEKRDRTGTGTISIFRHQMRFDLADGFPREFSAAVCPSSSFEIIEHGFERSRPTVIWSKGAF